MLPVDPKSARRIEDFIVSLSADELRHLNGLIIERLRQLATNEAVSIISRLSPGDNVWFNNGNQKLNGRVRKLNRKTVEVETSDGRIWRVSASLIYTFR